MLAKARGGGRAWPRPFPEGRHPRSCAAHTCLRVPAAPQRPERNASSPLDQLGDVAKIATVCAPLYGWCEFIANRCSSAATPRSTRTGAVIDLRLHRIQELAHVTAAAAGRSSTPFGTYIFRPADPGADPARHVEGRVFNEVFGYSPDTTDAEYGPYEGSTVFVCVLDHRRSLPVGAIRLVLPGGPGFKSLHDTARSWGREVDVASSGINLGTDEMWEIVTLSVDPGYRNGLVSFASPGHLHPREMLRRPLLLHRDRCRRPAPPPARPAQALHSKRLAHTPTGAKRPNSSPAYPPTAPATQLVADLALRPVA